MLSNVPSKEAECLITVPDYHAEIAAGEHTPRVKYHGIDISIRNKFNTSTGKEKMTLSLSALLVKDSHKGTDCSLQKKPWHASLLHLFYKQSSHALQ